MALGEEQFVDEFDPDNKEHVIGCAIETICYIILFVILIIKLNSL